MRKLATSLFTFATIAFLSQARMGSVSSHSGTQDASDFGGFDPRETFQGSSSIPVLGHHLKSGGIQSLGGLQDTQIANHTKPHSVDCDLSRKVHHKPDHCHCEHDDWGCDISAGRQPHAAQTIVTGVENSVLATVVPAQLLITNTSTVVNGTECQESRGRRVRNESERFNVEGKFCVSKFDCQEQCLSQASCFANNGTGRATGFEVEGEHDIEACECNPISSHDLLEIEQDCDCRIFPHHHDHRQILVDDPEIDVERRINSQIQQTIADVLSEIVQNVFHQSFEHVIEFN